MRKKTRKSIYSYRPKEYGTIKDAVAALINETSGLEEAGKLCRVGVTSLSHYANPSRKEQMPIDVVIELESKAECRVVTDHLAAQHQTVVFQYPKTGGHRNWLVHLAHTTEKFSNVAKLGAEHLTRGELNTQQCAEIKVALEKLMEKLAILHMALGDEETGDALPAVE